MDLNDQTKIAADNPEFCQFVDCVVRRAHEGGDKMLLDVIKEIDLTAMRQGRTFYEAMESIMRDHINTKKAREWLRSKINSS